MQHGDAGPGWRGLIALDQTVGYRDDEVGRSVSPMTTVDLRLGYRFRARAGLLEDVDLGLNVSNVFDSDPPFVDREYLDTTSRTAIPMVECGA